MYVTVSVLVIAELTAIGAELIYKMAALVGILTYDILIYSDCLAC